MRPKPRKFRLHFNRINMQRGKDEVWTIHLSDACISARVVYVHVPLRTVYRPTASQPRAWFEGKGWIQPLGLGEFAINPYDWNLP
jgi:hypothetical protein